MIPPIGREGKPLRLGLYRPDAHKSVQRAIENGPSLGESWGRRQGGTCRVGAGITQMWVRNRPDPIKFGFSDVVHPDDAR
jgi:hypothetical protein